MKYDYDIIVIGAGSGGLVVASGAASFGAKVALIEGHKMGGDCLNYGCVPSKSFLKPAHLAHDIKCANRYGLDDASFTPNMPKMMDYVRSIVKEIEPHDSKERYTGLGVDVKSGYGTFVDDHTVDVKGASITAKYIVIATGAEAFVPLIPGLDSVSFHTNKTIFDVTEEFKHLIVLGSGPIGLEIGQGFCHLGAKVTMIDMLPSLFAKDDPEVGSIMEKILKKDGVQFELEASIKEVRNVADGIEVVSERDGNEIITKGDGLFVALGRRPNTGSLGLDNSNIKLGDRGEILINDRLQTSKRHIYACGDVVGPYQFTHMAGYQAGIIIRNIVFKLRAKVNYSCVPWVTYTKPEVAHVGLTEAMAKESGQYHDHVIVDLSSVDRAKSDDDRHGFLKLIYNRKKRIVGVALVGEKAGEMIALGALAIQEKMSVTRFVSVIFPYPTQSEIYKFASLKVAKDSLKPWMKRIISKII